MQHLEVSCAVLHIYMFIYIYIYIYVIRRLKEAEAYHGPGDNHRRQEFDPHKVLVEFVVEERLTGNAVD